MGTVAVLENLEGDSPMKKCHTPFVRTLGIIVLLFAVFAVSAFAVQNRVPASPDLTQKVAIDHSASSAAVRSVDTGRLNASQNLGRIMLTLAPTDAQDQAAAALIQAQHDPKSAQFHKWLTPAQFGDQFGVSVSDATQVKNWLISQGLTVHEVSQSRRFITFSGSVGQVEKAFSTQLHSYASGGKTFIANSTSVQVPAALQSVIKGVNLADHPKQANLKIVKQGLFDPNSGVKGMQTFSDGAHFMTPADFATIYDVKPLYQAGINGAGQSIAIVGRTNISVADVNSFRSYYGLPANPPTIIINGDDPGVTGDIVEAMLDVEWSGAVAPLANVTYVASASNFDDGVAVSATYIVDHNLAGVMSTSYGLCEDYEAGNNYFWFSLWQQAAAEGITANVSTGDNGGAGCTAPGSGSLDSYGVAVNGIASTPYNVAVGGTQFDDTANPAQYWGLFSNASTKQSVLSYIPEKVWNESSNDPNSVSLWAGSGGESTWWYKPDWQTGDGVPNNIGRMLPDISLSAAGHDGYMIVYNGYLYSVGGTSAASPSFAGVMALVNQKTNSVQGQANYILYQLASGPNSNVIFHDIVNGDNKVPGSTGAFTVGYSAGPGYDMATGIGTVDVAQLVNHWADISLAASSQNSLTIECSKASMDCFTFPHGYQGNQSGYLGVHFQTRVASSTGSGPTPTGETVMIAVAQGNSSSVASGSGPASKTTRYVIANGAVPQPGGANVISGGNYPLFNGSADNYFYTLPGGTWKVYSQYSGDGNYSGSKSPSFTVNITKENSNTFIGPLTGGWQVANPVQLQYGESLPTAIYIYGNSGTGYPSGSVNIVVDGTTIGSTTLQYGEAGLSQQSSTFFTLNGLSVGPHTLAAAYPGDASFNSSASNTYSLTVGKADTYIYSFAQTGTAIPATPLKLSGYVGLNNTGSASLGGTLNLVNVTNPVAPVTLNAAPLTVGADGSFSGLVQFAAAGSYRVQAQFVGNASLSPSTYLIAVPVSATAATTTAIATSTPTVVSGTTASYTATVTSAVTGRIATGTVTFTDGATTLGTATLDSTGKATFTTTALITAVSHSISAAYGGDTYFNASASTTPAATLVSDYTIQVVPSTLTIIAGQSGTAYFNVLPVNGYNLKISFSCSGLPANASCVFNPSSVTPDGSNKPVSSTLTVYTSSLSVATQLKHNRWLGASAITFAGVLLALPFGIRKRRWGLAMLLTVITLVAFGIGCGSNSWNKNWTLPGSYSATAQAQGTASTGKTASLTIIVVK